MSVPVEFVVPLRARGPQAARAMFAILGEVSRRESPHERQALTFDLGSANPGWPASVSVEVVLEAVERRDEYACGLTIQARDHRAWFPTFTGTASVSPLQDEGSELWLQGAYDPPFGAAGAAVDAAILKGVARATLQRFAEWLATDIERRAEEATG